MIEDKHLMIEDKHSMIEDKHSMITVYLSFEKAQLSENFS